MTKAIAQRLGVSTTREGFAAIEPAVLVREQTAVAAGGSPLGGAPTVTLAIGGDAVPRDPLDGACRGRRARHPGHDRLDERGVPAVVRALRRARQDPSARR